jgi:glycosyltransferase involved in cell wall biosynthesis
MKKQDIKLTICFCVWNEQKNIVLCLEDTLENIQNIIGQEDLYEILVIDNASTDNTPDVVRKYEKRYPQIRLIRHPENYLYSGSHRTAFKEAKGNYIAIIDGDYQHTTVDIAKGLQLIRDKNCDVVYGWKKTRNDSLSRKIVSYGLKLISQKMIGHTLNDINCGYRIFSNDTVKRVKIVEKINAVGPEILCECRRLGFTMGEIPVQHFERKDGEALFDNPIPLIKGSIKYYHYLNRLRIKYTNRPIMETYRI